MPGQAGRRRLFARFSFRNFCQKLKLPIAVGPGTLLSFPLHSAVDPMQVLKVAHSQLFIRLASCQSLRSSNATFTAVDTLDLNRIGFLSFCCPFFNSSFSLLFFFFCSNSKYFMNFLINARAKTTEIYVQSGKL